MDQLLKAYENYLSEIALKPSDGGRFEVAVDGDVVFSKLATGRFPGDEELLGLVRGRIGA